MVATFFCAILLEIPKIKMFLSTFFMIFSQNFAKFWKMNSWIFFNFSRMSNFCHMWTQILVGGNFLLAILLFFGQVLETFTPKSLLGSLLLMQHQKIENKNMQSHLKHRKKKWLIFLIFREGRRGPREERINNTTHHESGANANMIINHPPKPNICPSPLVQII
jgi:hypothetical protein